MQLGFGAGAAWLINTAANSTPVRVGVMQSISLSEKATTKALHGSNQLPVSQARGTVNITGKMQFAQFNSRLWHDIWYGSMSSAATGQTLAIDSEAGTVPGSSTYTVTVANSSTWVTDLGVVYAATGLPLTRGASASAQGIYSVAAGVYTFHSSDASAAVKISYTYTATGGESLTVTNQPMGSANTFKLVLSIPFNSQKITKTYNRCIAESLDMSTGLEDYTKVDMGFACFTDSSDVLCVQSFAEAI
jgi:hypothetical protein